MQANTQTCTASFRSSPLHPVILHSHSTKPITTFFSSFLRFLLSSVYTPQIYHPFSKWIAPASNKSTCMVLPAGLGSLNVLSDELLLELLSHLGPTDLTRASTASKALYCFCRHDEIWKALLLQVRCTNIFRHCVCWMLRLGHPSRGLQHLS